MSDKQTYELRQPEFDCIIPIAPPLQAATKTSAKPFIKWVGGKSQLLPALISRLPKNLDFSATTYIEPFIGGGAFFFWLLSNNKPFKKVIINDANTALINTYKVIRDMPEELIDTLSAIKEEYIALDDTSKQKEYYYEKRVLFNSGDISSLEKAAYLIFLNKTCFNGLYRVNAKGLFNVPHGSYSNPLICDPDTIRADSALLQNVEIRNSDFASVLQDVDEHCFVYFDPPYRPLSETSSFCSYCEGGFDDNEQQRLAECCRIIAQKGGRWLLSNSDPKGLCPDDCFFDRLYQGFNIQTVQANRMLNANPKKRGKLSELLISNY